MSSERMGIYFRGKKWNLLGAGFLGDALQAQDV